VLSGHDFEFGLATKANCSRSLIWLFGCPLAVSGGPPPTEIICRFATRRMGCTLVSRHRLTFRVSRKPLTAIILPAAQPFKAVRRAPPDGRIGPGNLPSLTRVRQCAGDCAASHGRSAETDQRQNARRRLFITNAMQFDAIQPTQGDVHSIGGSPHGRQYGPARHGSRRPWRS
jgi:hypothetical protein